MDHKPIREQTIRDAKSGIILDAARKVFSEKGLHESRLEDIADAAGYSKASLYNYFTDKEQIFLTLAIRDFEELLTKLRTGLEVERDLLSSVEFVYKTVLTFFGEQFAFLWEINHFQTACNFDIQKLHGQHHEMVGIFQNHYSGLLEAIVEILRAARRRGEIRTGADEITLARFIAALVRGTVFEWKISGARGDIDQTVKDLLEFTARGFGYQSAPGGSAGVSGSKT